MQTLRQDAQAIIDKELDDALPCAARWSSFISRRAGLS